MDQVWGWLGWLAAGLATIVAIRGSVRIDVTEWLKERRRQKETNLRLLCPHASGGVDEVGNPGILSAYVSLGSPTLGAQLKRHCRATASKLATL